MGAPAGNKYALGNQGGRPSLWSQELADILCLEIATTTKSLRRICNENENLPEVSTILRWLRENKDFCLQYTRAKEEQADLMVDEMIDIADDKSRDMTTFTKGGVEYQVEDKEVTNRSRLRVDTRKWIAGRLKPKKYGEKLDVTTDGDKISGPFHVILVPPKTDEDE